MENGRGRCRVSDTPSHQLRWTPRSWANNRRSAQESLNGQGGVGRRVDDDEQGSVDAEGEAPEARNGKRRGGKQIQKDERSANSRAPRIAPPPDLGEMVRPLFVFEGRAKGHGTRRRRSYDKPPPLPKRSRRAKLSLFFTRRRPPTLGGKGRKDGTRASSSSLTSVSGHTTTIRCPGSVTRSGGLPDGDATPTPACPLPSSLGQTGTRRLMVGTSDHPPSDRQLQWHSCPPPFPGCPSACPCLGIPWP